MIKILKIQKRGISKYSQILNFESSRFSNITEEQYNTMTNSLDKEQKNIIKKVLKEKTKLQFSFVDVFLKRDPYYEDNPNELVIDIDKFSFKNFFFREFWTNPHADHYLFLSSFFSLLSLYLLLLFKRFLLKNYKVENSEKLQAIEYSSEDYDKIKKKIKKKFKDVFDDFEDLDN